MPDRAHIPASPLTPAQAKLNLLEWSADADAEIADQFHQLVSAAKTKARRTVPWAAGGIAAAIISSILLGRRRNKLKHRPSLLERLMHATGAGAPREDRPASHWPMIAKLALDLAPVALGLLRRRQQRR